MNRYHYSGPCKVCGTVHRKSFHQPMGDHPEDDFLAMGCQNPSCDPRNDAFLTRDPEGFDPTDTYEPGTLEVLDLGPGHRRKTGDDVP